MTFKSTTQPLCLWCGKHIRKSTSPHWFGHNVGFYAASRDRSFHHGERPTSREEAQRYINEQIVSVEWSRLTHDGEVLPRSQQFIHRVGVWDGESYDDEFFCNGDHSRRFAYAAARKGLAMPAYNEALRKRRAKVPA